AGTRLLTRRARPGTRPRRPTPRARRKTYRHGNLRADAITAAYAMLADAGGTSLSLRRVADTIGVAHRSLYNHFADREALLNAVARRGFLRLAGALRSK